MGLGKTMQCAAFMSGMIQSRQARCDTLPLHKEIIAFCLKNGMTLVPANFIEYLLMHACMHAMPCAPVVLPDTCHSRLLRQTARKWKHHSP